MPQNPYEWNDLSLLSDPTNGIKEGDIVFLETLSKFTDDHGLIQGEKYEVKHVIKYSTSEATIELVLYPDILFSAKNFRNVRGASYRAKSPEVNLTEMVDDLDKLISRKEKRENNWFNKLIKNVKRKLK